MKAIDSFVTATRKSRPIIHTRRFALASLVAAALLGPVAPHAHAAAPHDQNVGIWNNVCRVYQIHTYETITVGSDTTWDRAVCAAFYNAPANAYNQGYDYFPLTMPRPSTITCSFVYRYGGYWEEIYPPYRNSLGAAIITVRDTYYDTASSAQNGSTTYGQVDCWAIQSQLDSINAQNGFNDTTHPLATIYYCQYCGGEPWGQAVPSPDHCPKHRRSSTFTRNRHAAARTAINHDVPTCKGP